MLAGVRGGGLAYPRALVVRLTPMLQALPVARTVAAHHAWNSSQSIGPKS